MFYTLAVLTSLAIMVYAGRGRAQPSWRDLAWPGAVLAVPLLSMLVTNAYLGIWSGSEFEKLLRFALALPLFWVLLCVPRPWLQQIQWSLLFSAYAGAIMLYVIVGWYGGRMQVSFYGAEYNAVAFANLTLFFGFASLLTLGWRLTPWPGLEALLKVGRHAPRCMRPMYRRRAAAGCCCRFSGWCSSCPAVSGACAGNWPWAWCWSRRWRCWRG